MQPTPQSTTRTKPWIVWTIVVVMMLVLSGVIVGGVLITRFFDEVQQTEREANPARSSARVLGQADGPWRRQVVSSLEFEFEAPAIMRPNSTTSEDQDGYETFVGVYPRGCVDIYVTINPVDGGATKEDHKLAIEEWIAEFDGVDSVEVRASELAKVDRERAVFEARYIQDGYPIVHFVEIRAIGDREVWLTLHAFVETAAAARDDFARMIRSAAKSGSNDKPANRV